MVHRLALTMIGLAGAAGCFGGVRTGVGLSIDTGGHLGVMARASMVTALGQETSLALVPVEVGGGVTLDGTGFLVVGSGGGVARELGEVPFSAAIKVRMRWDWRGEGGPESRIGPGLSAAVGRQLTNDVESGRGQVQDLGATVDAFLLFDRDRERELPMRAAFFVGGLYQWFLFFDNQET